MVATKSIEAAVEAIRGGEGDDTVTYLPLAELGLEREQSSEIQIRFYYYKAKTLFTHLHPGRPLRPPGRISA